MASKSELLALFSQYDVDTLTKLEKYADQLLIPDSEMITSVTMQDMIIKANELADIYFPSWTDRSKSDFGAFLIEIFAWFSEKDFWYLNAWGTQQLMSDVVDYDLGYRLSLRGGYKPKTYKPARLAVQVSFSPGGEVYFAPGTLILKDANSGILYSNYNGITIKETGSVTRLETFIQGTLQNTTVNFSGDVVRVLQERTWLQSVKIGDNFWEDVDDFSLYKDSSKVYMHVPELNGFKILFGDGQLGLRPALQEPIKLQMYSSNLDWSLPGETLVVETNSSGRAVTSSVVVSVEEGIKKMTLNQMKTSLYAHRQTGGVIIRPEDLQIALEDQPEIVRAVAYSSIDVLYYFVVPVEGVVADQAFLNTLIEKLQTRIVAGLYPIGLITTYVDLTDMELTVFVENTYSLKNKEQEVRNLVSNYTNPEVEGRFKRNFFVSDFQNYLLARTAGATNIVVNLVMGTPPSELNPINVVPINLGNIIQHIKSENGGVVTGNSTTYTRTLNGLKINVQYVS